MNEFVEGSVIICGSGQAGSIVQIAEDVWVLLRNGDIWVGPQHRLRFPQSQEDLDQAPIDVERAEQKRDYRDKD